MSGRQAASENARDGMLVAIAAIIAFALGNVLMGFLPPDPFPSLRARPDRSVAREANANPEDVPNAGSGPAVSAGPRRFGPSFGSPRYAPAAGTLPAHDAPRASSIPAERFVGEGDGRYPVPQSMHVAQTSPSTEPGSFHEWAQAETDPRRMLSRMAILARHVPRTIATEPTS